MKELKNNVNTLLWLMVTLSVMVVFLTLSSCRSSVNPDGKGGKTPDDPPVPKITVTYGCSDNNGTIEAKIISSKEGKIEGNKIINLVSGDKVQFTAKPSDGYKFKEWIPKQLGNKETFELTVDKALSVSVEFEKEPDSMSILEFLEYKIGFDKESEVVYGKDGKYNPEVLYDANNFGFGKNDNGNLCYHGMKDSKYSADSCIGKLTAEEISKISDIFKEYGYIGDFTSIYDGLYQRWMAMKKCANSNKYWYYYSSNETPDKLPRRLIGVNVGGYKFALGSDKEDYKLYMKANSASKYSYYMDLRIAFVKESDPDKGYSVHFANVKDGKYEPYVLHNAGGDSKYTTYPPCAEPKYTESTEEGMRMFRLSSLLKTSLENLHKKESKEWKYSEEQLINALLEEVKSKNYDIYVIFGVMYQRYDYKIFSGLISPGFVWRNVLKFGDPIWAENQTQP